MTSNKAYTYQICSKCADESGSYSTVKTIWTTPKTPSAPSVTTTKNSVTISWDAITGATSYDVLLDDKTYRVAGTSKTITGLTPGTTYTYQVRANNAGGSGEYSDPQTVMTIPNPPTVPMNVSVSVTADSATLSWNPVEGATSYDVMFNGTTYNVTNTSKTITGLTSETNYRYSVRANNAGGSSSYTDSKTVQTPEKPPTTPTNVGTATTANSVTLSWNPVIGAISYDILFDGKTYNVTGRSKTISGLTPGTSYTYQIRANNTGGSSSYSIAETVFTIPDKPTNVRASVMHDSVTVSWNSVTGATSYSLLFDGKSYSVTSTSKTITGLIPDTSYWFSVCANNAGGSSSYTTSQNAWTSVKPPTVPTNVSATVTASSATIKWSAVAGATGYDLLFNGTTYNLTGTSATFNGLTSNTNYNYAVRAKNLGGTSAYSTTQTLRTLLNPPTNIKATATKNYVTVSWNAVSGATSYDVQFSGTTYNVTSTSKTITGLISGAFYSYAVRAKNNNAFGPSVYSETQIVQTIPEPPAVPANISATATANSITINWSAVDKAAGYDVIFNGSVYNATSSTITFTGLTLNQNYSYQVRAKNLGGISAYSDAKAIRTLLYTPTNIKATATTDSILLSWDMVSGASIYNINFDGTIYNVTDTFIEFTKLIPETSHTYAIQAKNEFVLSGYSQTFTVSTLNVVPPVPSNVNAISTFNGVFISWDPVDEAIGYDVEFDGKTYNVGGAARMRSALRSTNRSMTIDTYIIFVGLKPNTKHTYCVRTNGEKGSSDYSPLKSIVTKISKQSGLPNVKSNQRYLDGRIPYMGLDPVNALTGAFLWSYTYLEDYGKDALHFTTMYDSQRDEYPKALGNKWTYSLNYQLYMDSEYAYFSTPYDEVIPFCIDAENDSYQLAEGISSYYTMRRREDQSYAIKDLDGTEYIFDNNLCLSKMIEGGVVTYQFIADEERQTIRIESRHGGALSLTYANGHISRVTDVMGHVVTFTYNGDYLVSAENPNGNGMSFIYDDSGNLLEITDFAGKSHVTNQYDLKNRVVEQNTAGRGNSFASYDETNRITTFTDELGNATKYCYDEEFHVTDVELAGTGLRSKYNENGQLVEQVDRLLNSTKMAYDNYGRMNHVIYPDNTEEEIFYDEKNSPIRIVNRDGSESLYEYDTRNNLIAVQDERGNISTYSYDDEDNLITYTDRYGNVWTYTYDTNHHLEQAADPEGNIYKYSHDPIGRLLSSASPTGSTITYHYSEAGDLLRMVDGDGTTAFDYNENGNQTGITGRMGNKQRLEYNEMGQVSLATDFMGNEYTFVYDQKGNLVKETDPLGYSQGYAYDAIGNRTAWTYKNGGTTNYSFDAVGQVTEVKDAAGNLITYAYDTMGQVKTVTDALHHQTNYTYDTMGRITSVTNALGHSVSYTYDI